MELEESLTSDVFIDQLLKVECFNVLLKLPLRNGSRTHWFASFGSTLALCFQICFPTLIWPPIAKCYASERKKKNRIWIKAQVLDIEYGD